jgi:hypothetical protein
MEHNIVITAGSDSPCTDPDPMLGIHNACNHPVKTQALTVEEAVRMATYWGYWASFDEKERGSLEVGKTADMVILQEDPYSVPKETLKDIRSISSFWQEDPMKNRAGAGRMVLRGLLGSRKYRNKHDYEFYHCRVLSITALVSPPIITVCSFSFL